MSGRKRATRAIIAVAACAVVESSSLVHGIVSPRFGSISFEKSEIDQQTMAGRFGDALQDADRRLRAASFESGDAALIGF
jgi:hypothetical protein